MIQGEPIPESACIESGTSLVHDSEMAEVDLKSTALKAVPHLVQSTCQKHAMLMGASLSNGIFLSGYSSAMARYVTCAAFVGVLHSAFCAPKHSSNQTERSSNYTNQTATPTRMTITKIVTSDLFETGPANQRRLIRMNQRFSGCGNIMNRKSSTMGWWTTDEHDKFLEAMELYPSGPWKKIAQHIGSRSPRQVMTHAQKYRQRIKRRENRKTRGKCEQLKKGDTATSKSENRKVLHEVVVDEELLNLLLEQELVAIEPLPLETTASLTEEATAADVLLFDELQHLLDPGIGRDSRAMELDCIDCDELIEVLLDPAINWESVSM